MYSNYIIGHAGDWAQLGNSRAWPFESSVSRAQGWDALPAPFRGQFLLLAPPGEQSVTVALPREAGVRAAPAASSVRPSLVSPKVAFAATVEERFCPALFASLKMLLEKWAELVF